MSTSTIFVANNFIDVALDSLADRKVTAWSYSTEISVDASRSLMLRVTRNISAFYGQITLDIAIVSSSASC